MSGRPAAPAYTVLEWAPDASYPAGVEPWSGNPTKVDPPGRASVGFTPGTGVSAQQHNYGLHHAYAQDAAAKSAIAAVLEYVGQAQALNFPTRITSISTSQRFVTFAAATCKWYMTAAETIQVSPDGGLSWSQDTTVPGYPCGKLDADNGGNVVAATVAAQYVYELNASTSTWTQRTVLAGHTYFGHVVFDPVSGYWVWYSVNAVGAFQCRRSSDRATWTAATTVPASWGSSTDVADLACNKTSGRVVVIARSNATTIKVATTDDGGNTWTERTALTTTIDAAEISLAHNADEGAWYLTIGETTGTPSCEVWRSTDDAVTFTKVATLAAACVHRIAGFGALLVGMATTADGVHVVYSANDMGATWRKAGRRLEGTARGVFAGPAPLALSASHLYVGHALGLPLYGVLA